MNFSKACRSPAVVAQLLCSLGALHATAAGAAETTVAVLGIEATDDAPEAVAAALTDALRTRISSTSGFKLVPGKDLVELKLIFACPDEAPTCMADVGKTLGAAKLLFGGVKKAAGDNFVVTLKLLDVARKQVDALIAEQITRAQSAPGAIKVPVQKWFATLTGQEALGTLRLTGDVPGTAVQLDGSPVGALGAAPLVLNNIAAGRHELLGSKPGFAPVRQTVEIAAGGAVDLRLDLGASPSSASGTGSSDLSLRSDNGDRGSGRDGKSGLRAAGWATLVAGAISLIPAIKFTLDISQINSDLDPYRRAKCVRDRTKLCKSDGVTDAKGLNASEEKYVADLQTEGDKFQTLQYVFYGLGGALVVTGGVLLYLGYGTSSSSDAQASQGIKWQFAPVFTPSSAGALGGFSF